MNPELEELKRSLKTDPKDGKILRKLANHYLSGGYFKQAKEEYLLAAAFSPRLVSEIMLDHEHFILGHQDSIQARLLLASFCLNANDLTSATLELEEILDLDPNCNIAYNLLGRIYIRSERIDEALKLLESALSHGVKDLKISEMLASVYLEKGRLSEALRFYEELPQDKNTLRTLGELYTRTKQYESAAAKYFEMFKQDPEVAQEVLRKIEDLLLLNETSINIREMLADLYLRSLKPDQAAAKLTEIIKLAPAKLEEIIEKLKRNLKNYPHHPATCFALAEALTLKGNYSETVEVYRSLVKSQPDLLPVALTGCRQILEKFPQQFLARQFLIEGLIKLENYKEALQECLTLLAFYKEGADWVIGKCRELAKKEPYAREVLGYAYLSAGDHSRATLEAETLLAADRNHPPAYILLGEIFLEQRLSRKAVEAFHRALELDPNNRLIHARYAHARGKELDLEVESIKKRLLDDEWKISLHLDLAKVYLTLGKREEALRELQLSLKDVQRAPFVYQLLGNFYREEGRFDLAVSSYEKGLEGAPADQPDLKKHLKFSLALTYEAQGLIKKSIKLFEEILQEDVDFPDLKEKIKYLKASSLASVQNKMLVAIKDFAFWGREARGGAKRQTLAVSFGGNYNNSGMDYFMKGMHPAALEEFTLACQLDPDFVAAVNNLGVTLLVTGQLDEAQSKLRAAFELEPSSAIISNNLGLTYLLQNNLSEARKWLTKAQAVDAGLSAAALNLADLIYEEDQAQSAIALYRKIPATDVLGDLAGKRLLYKIP